MSEPKPLLGLRKFLRAWHWPFGQIKQHAVQLGPLQKFPIDLIGRQWAMFRVLRFRVRP